MLKRRFIPTPIRYIADPAGTVAASPDSLEGIFHPLASQMLLQKQDPAYDHSELPYDFYCPSVNKAKFAKLVCKRCGLYSVTQRVALRGHHCRAKQPGGKYRD